MFNKNLARVFSLYEFMSVIGVYLLINYKDISFFHIFKTENSPLLQTTFFKVAQNLK